MCARASSQQSAIEPVTAVAAPTEGRRELAAAPSFLSILHLHLLLHWQCDIVQLGTGGCGDKGRCGVHIVG